ncbi:hypothetical protein VNO78_01839 [Psophocarpus tetragonolobus]|uniref:Uncharacterized protein n=1 Tax=Psophocarpus tetragonolobus TaxID=3891 RepID=A0AAN9TAR1_PSOTE
MLCSAQTGKAGLNWLDRLRSNKGIPTGDEPDLDSFLLTTHPQSPQARPNRNPPSEARDHPRPMTTILAELFCMGATLTQTNKKCPRKQTNPKIFLASSAATTIAASAAPSSAYAVVPQVEEEAPADRADEEEGNELKGFSKSEVTVIDTSCPGWKVDKFVFRKNNVWKVRERKPKNKFLAKRKSNSTLSPRHVDVNAIDTSKDVIMRGEKPIKTQKAYLKSRKENTSVILITVISS